MGTERFLFGLIEDPDQNGRGSHFFVFRVLVLLVALASSRLVIRATFEGELY